MSQMTCNGRGPASSLTSFAVAVGVIGDHRRDQAPGPLAHRRLDPGHHFRGERPADDRPQPLMPRIVHHDHRAEVLGDLRRLVADGDFGLELKISGWRLA